MGDAKENGSRPQRLLRQVKFEHSIAASGLTSELRTWAHRARASFWGEPELVRVARTTDCSIHQGIPRPHGNLVISLGVVKRAKLKTCLTTP